MPIAIITKEYYQENTTMSTNEFVVTLLGIAVSIAFVFFLKLKTKIDEIGVHYQFFPFHFSMKTIRWQEIKKANIRTYDPIGEYGGWGLKGGALWNKSKGKAITISGDIGIQLELKNNKKLLIGTQKKEDAFRVLEVYKNSK